MHHHGKRRGTPVPVAPPRVPTPMPPNNNNICRSKDCDNTKSVVHKTTTASSSGGGATSGQYQHKLVSKTPFRLLDNDVKTAWINPRLMSKIDMELVKRQDYVSPYHQRNVNQCGRTHDHREWDPMTSQSSTSSFVAPQPRNFSVVPNQEPIAAALKRSASKTGGVAARKTMQKSAGKKTRGQTLATLNAQALQQVAYKQQTRQQCKSDAVFGVEYVYTVNSVGTSLAQASAAAAFFARAAQKLNLSSSPHRRKRHNSDETTTDSAGFCGALQRCPPPVPPALLRRIGVREVTGVGKVKVMLRVSSRQADGLGGGFFSLDKRKKQVTLVDPQALNGPPAPEDRRVGVAAPKMFAFDAIFSQDDSQSEVCSSALTDVIHAVINGTDGCLFCFGHAGLGKSYTMLGTPETANTLGIIPCAISWLFKGINEQKQKTGARFSVRVSAVEVCGPTNQLRDLLAGYSNDSEQSPGMYLRDDPLFGNQPPHCELRVPSAEKAAQYLDAAMESRTPATTRGSHLLFTLHVYQYSVAGKGGVAGGRSRLHLIDLGNSERGKSNGGIPLSGLGNVLLAIFNGQKHLPYKEHKLTQLLKDCLSSLTCHAAMIVHVSPSAQHYTETLTTVQLASRIHRMRRRKIKFVSSAAGNGSGGSSGEEQTRTTGTSSEPDPSSSDLSADTVIYVGRADDATDGEHPPVYIPSLNSGDNRCVMSKALRGSTAEQRTQPARNSPKPETNRPVKTAGSARTSPAHANLSPGRIAAKKTNENALIMKHSVNGANSDEQWIDGPRISKSKVAEARHLMKEPCHVKKRETWIDGPMQDPQTYGYMDSHKKNMIRKWVEHQTIQIRQIDKKPSSKHKESKQAVTEEPPREEVLVVQPLRTAEIEESVIRTGLKLSKSDEDDDEEPELPPALPIIQPLSSREVSLESLDQILKERMLSYQKRENNDDDDEDLLEIIEVEEPLEPVPTMDSCLQVTEEDIALCMGFAENPLPEVDQENPLDHPLRVLSQENLTVVSTFTDSMSVFTDLERILPRRRYERYRDDYEDPDNPSDFDDSTRKKFDQLAKLHELYTHRLARAGVTNSSTYREQQRLLTRCESLTLNDMLYGDGGQNDASSIYSEPAYVREKFCENCRVSMSGTPPNWYENLSASTQDLTGRCANAGGVRRFRLPSCKTTDREEDVAFLRHPDGASNPNLLKETASSREDAQPLDASSVRQPASSITVQPNNVARMNRAILSLDTGLKLAQKCDEYDSGHDSTPRTSKHSPAAISRRAESGYDSVVRDSESSSIDSEPTRFSHLVGRRGKCKHKHEKSFCSWFLNPFTCKYIDEPPETHF